jgi:hypothetical protein
MLSRTEQLTARFPVPRHRFAGAAMPGQPSRERRYRSAHARFQIKRAVMAGPGIAFISAHTIAAEIANGRLAMLKVVDFLESSNGSSYA